MREVTIEEAPQHLRDLVEAAVNGEQVVIMKGDQPLVQLVPMTLPRRKPQFGSARGGVIMADDFDAPLTDFAEN
jgi:antitoxin (DNA-binding transcriptional repressor) of toxin-antitoxin stability system